jgi:hypothetical protein
MLRFLFFIILFFHGSIHLMGFFKSVNSAAIAQLQLPVSQIAGIFWLIAALIFVSSALLFLLRNPYWWIPALSGLVISQILVIIAWQDAKFGTIANILVLIPVLSGILGSLPSDYGIRFRKDVQKLLPDSVRTELLTEADIEHLPPAVIRYLYFTGVVGKPKVLNFRAEFTGSMRQKPGASWLKIKSEQYNFALDPARLFYIESSMFGIPFNGYHYYIGKHAVMLIRLANLITVADARGEKMDQGETVTLFNDMCLLAPSTLIDNRIQWQEISEKQVEATFKLHKQTIHATLIFNEEGALTDFISTDRFLSADGKTYESYPWSTPVARYKDSEGRKIPAYGEAVWHMPGGPFPYARFKIRSLSYNLPNQ